MIQNPPYLAIEPAIEKQITENRTLGIRHPLYFPDEAIVRRTDYPNDRATVFRPAFVRDVEKILHIPAYNRYAGKTQVFSLVENDNICRRGLHVQLVSRISRTIGSALGLNLDLIEAIALGHDLGHTPFGHAGERFLSQVYHEHTGNYFNHNVNSVRVLDVLYRRNISLQVLDGALCHNGEFEQQELRLGTVKTFEEFDALTAACETDESNIEHLRPSTLEGCVVRMADMIAYLGKDRDDAREMGILANGDAFDTTVLGKNNAIIINNMSVDIINNSFGRERIAMSPEMFADVKLAKRQNYDRIYLKEGLVTESKNLVEEMFRAMYEHLLADLLSGNETSPIFTHHCQNLADKSKTWTMQSYLAQEPNRIVCDYISSMTDNYFVALYEALFPGSKNPVTRGYFDCPR